MIIITFQITYQLYNYTCIHVLVDLSPADQDSILLPKEVPYCFSQYVQLKQPTFVLMM